MVHLIVGYGEVGKALHKVLGKGTQWIDREHHKVNCVPDVIHICIPWSDEFKKTVSDYKGIAPMIIVHSSVPVGTCDELEVIHSPIRGVHPYLEEGIRTFVKYFGGKQAKTAAKMFTDLGLETKVFKYARTSEALKLWDTTQYGRLIMLEKEIHAWCDANSVSFNDVYTRANKDYNDGYTKLDMPNVVRPYLRHVPGPIGGHCVLPNAKLLGVKLW